MARRGHGEGSIYKDEARGRWVAEATVLGQRRRRVATTKAQAVAALKELQRSSDQGVAVDGSLTVGQVLTSWLASLEARELAPATVEVYRWCCTELVALLGRERAGKLSPETVEHAFAKLAADGTSRASLVKMRSVLAQALDRAVRRGSIARNVARVAELPAQARRSERGAALTAEQVAALLAVTAGTPLHAAWVVMSSLGLRPGECLGLLWSDIEDDVLTVRRSLKVVDGKAVVTEALKTAGSRRSLRIPTTVADALAEHQALQARQRRHAGDAWTETGLIFATGWGTPWRPENARRTFTNACMAAGIGEWSPNDLQHHCATGMGERGVALERIADVLGHTTTRMAYETYRRRPAVVDVIG